MRRAAAPARFRLRSRLLLTAAGWGLAAFTVLSAPAQELGGEAAEAPPADSSEMLEQEFQQALDVFFSVDQSDSIELFGRLIERLEGVARERPLAHSERRLLTRSHFRRAEARFNLGSTEEAEADLEAALRAEPGLEVDTAQISPKLAQLLAEKRSELVGHVELALEPVDARLEIDGEPVATPAPGAVMALLSGRYRLSLRRPGFDGRDVDLEVVAGSRERLEIALERTGAVVWLATRPAHVEILVDGRPIGETRPPTVPLAPPFLEQVEPPGEAETAAAEQGEIAIEGLALGSHQLELRKQGFRTRTLEIDIGELADYEPAAVSLEPARGTLVLSGLGDDVPVVVDGLEHAGRGGELRLELPEGEHRIVVDRGVLGVFDQSIRLADQQNLEIAVRLRPRLAFLGVLGGDREAAAQLIGSLEALFSLESDWLFSDLSARASSRLAEIGLGAGRLRGDADAPPPPTPADWRQAQEVADREFGASVYLLTVLSDDLFAREAELYVWAASPGPAVPARRKLDLTTSTPLAGLAGLFAPPTLSSAWLGARTIDSAAAEGPVVLEVDEGGPAAAAGLRPGDVLLKADGKELASTAALRKRVTAGREGEELSFDTLRAGQPRALRVRIGQSPLAVSPADRDLLVPAAWAWWAMAGEQSDTGVPGWLIDLNRASGYLALDQPAEAARALRGTRAPDSGGVGQGTVDYWLGVALLETDPVTYSEQARDALSRARDTPGARLRHGDGLLVAPRAAARLGAP